MKTWSCAAASRTSNRAGNQRIVFLTSSKGEAHALRLKAWRGWMRAQARSR